MIIVVINIQKKVENFFENISVEVVRTYVNVDKKTVVVENLVNVCYSLANNTYSNRKFVTNITTFSLFISQQIDTCH